MKILYLVSGVGPDARGTAFIQELIFTLSKRGIKATIVTPVYFFHKNWGAWAKKQSNKHKVKIVAAKAPMWIQKRFLLHLYLSPIFITLAAMNLLRKEKIDLIHEFTSIPVVLLRTFIFKAVFKVPSVVSLCVYNKTILGRPFWIKLFNFAQYYLIPSRELIERLKSLNVDKKKIIYSPPGINLVPFKKKTNKSIARKSLGLPEKKIIFSYFGPLSFEKGVAEIIKAVQLVNKQFENKFLAVMSLLPSKGDREHQKIKREINNLSLPNLLIRERRIDVPTLLAASDCVILPQHTGHGTSIPPLSTIEALAAKKAIIATNILGNRELLKNISVLVPPKDPYSLARAIEEIIDERPQHPIKTTLNVFRIESSIKRHLRLYKTILS